MIGYIVLILAVGILIWRIVLPMGNLLARTEPGASDATATPAPSAPPKGSKEKWYSGHERYLWTAVLVIVGGVLAYKSYDIKVRLADIGDQSWDHLLTAIIIWGTLAAIIAIYSATLGKAALVMQKVLAGVMIIVFILLPAWNWLTGGSSLGCVSGHPCVLSQDEDGSSNTVVVPKGKTVCFDPGTWRRIGKLGFMISYQAAGEPMEPFPCSVAEVYGGSCTAVYDHFSFKPLDKTTKLPNYWFVASGSRQC